MTLYTNRTDGYVYIAKDELGNVKLGGASNVNKRLAQLRRKTHSIKLVAQIRSFRFMYLEKFLHLELKDYEIAREWYSDEQKVLEIVINFLKQHGSIFGAYDIHILPR